MTLPGFSAESVIDRARRRTYRLTSVYEARDAVVVPALRCDGDPDDWFRCCSGNYCCIWNGDRYYGCGWPKF